MENTFHGLTIRDAPNISISEKAVKEIDPLRAARSVDVELFDHTESGFAFLHNPPHSLPHGVLSSQKNDSSPYLMPTNYCDYLVPRQVGFSSGIAVHAWITLKNQNGDAFQIVFICPIFGWASADIHGKAPPGLTIEFIKQRKSFGIKGNVYWEIRITSQVNSPKFVSYINRQEPVLPPRDLFRFKAGNLRRDDIPLGQGQEGKVFLGYADGVSPRVVIKDRLGKVDNDSMEKWANEIKILQQNRCRQVVEIHGFHCGPDKLSIITEVCSNGDLHSVLYKKKLPLNLVQRLRMARHCVLGIHFLHEHNFMHRDIKSPNILVTEDYSCKISDMGLAVALPPGQVLNENVGSLLWCAPEVFTNGEYGRPADIFSLGLVLFEIFHNQLPNRKIVNKSTTVYSKLFVTPCIALRFNRPTIAVLLQQVNRFIIELITYVHLAGNLKGVTAVTANNENALESAFETMYKALLELPESEVNKIVGDHVKAIAAALELENAGPSSSSS